MIRGWRNDPLWVEFYKRRDEERVKRQMERAKLEMELALKRVRDEARSELLKRPMKQAWESW